MSRSHSFLRVRTAMLALSLLSICHVAMAAPPIFSNPQFRVGDSPWSIASGDFNRDGKQDISTANYESGNVSILLGNGDLTFQPAVHYAVGTNAFSVKTGDFNRDGSMDIVTANPGGGNVSVLLNSGNGAFGAATNYATGQGPVDVVVRDFNGDTKPDIAAADSGGTLQVLTGNGDGTFQTISQPIEAGAYSIGAGDFNGDQKPDIALTYPNANKVTALSGNGDGTFGPAVDYAVGEYPYYLAVGDLNADGAADIATVSASGVSVRLCRGDGTFHAAVPYATEGAGWSIRIRDVNGDSKPDIVTGKFNTLASVLLNNGDGVFQPAMHYDTSFGAFTVEVADFNGDTKPEIASASYYTDLVTVLPNRGDGTFGTVLTQQIPALYNPGGVGCADFNGDGKPDVAFPGHNETVVLLGNGSGAFQVTTYPSSGEYLAIADFNGDNRPDIVVSRISIYVLINNGNGTFQPAVEYQNNLPFFVAAGDVNSDGKPDIVTARTDGQGFSVMLNQGNGTFLSPVQHPTGKRHQDIELTDVNSDGKLDVLTADGLDSGVSVILGNGNGTFQTAIHYPVNGQPHRILAADLNGDNRPEVITNNRNGAVVVLMNNGEGSFQPEIPYAADYEPWSLASGDFNGDGKADIVTGSFDTGNVSVLLGNGDGTLLPAQMYAAESHSTSINSLCVSDFNADGKPDLFCPGHNSIIAVLFNQSSPSRAVSGTLILEDIVPEAAAQEITFTFRLQSGSEVVRTAPIAPDGLFSFPDIPAGDYTLHIKGPKYLAANVAVDATNGNVFDVMALLRAGDTNDDNLVSVDDLAALIESFDADPTSPNWNNGVADFNGDDLVAVDDLALLIRNFDAEGDP